ncbi:hypothetical protein NDU88_002007 [Pleurodeles waltl]|uniref:Uncharacterized protein n=1 Tax=Pleurodeles waltl TaxID=8319 RepID=A0AAV7NLU5_PLEWA|nr:hypothetical protein NDU88_002007 [Pleurodeles waltl]
MLAPRPGALHHHLGTQPLQAPQPLCHSLGGRWRPPTSGALTTLPLPGVLHLAPFVESAASAGDSTGRHTPSLIPERLGGRPHPDPGAAPPAEPPAASAWPGSRPHPVPGQRPQSGDQRLHRRPNGVAAGQALPNSGPRPLFLPRPPAAHPSEAPGRVNTTRVLLWGSFSPSGRGSSGQTRSGPPAACSADRSGFAAARFTMQGPGSGRGMGHRLLSPLVQLALPETTPQGQDGGSAAPRTALPGCHLCMGSDRPGDGTLLHG